MGRLGIRVPPSLGADLFVRIGPDGDLFGLRRRGLSRKKLIREGGPIKLADHCSTGVLRKRLQTKDRRVHLDHDMFADELRRLVATETTDPKHPLRLFTIRELRSQNSWLHNVPKLMARPPKLRGAVEDEVPEAPSAEPPRFEESDVREVGEATDPRTISDSD
jgi:hypothetical protein